MTEGTKSVWRQIIGGLLIAACSGSLGYGYSQQTIGNQMRDNTKDIAANKDAIIATNHRIDRVADLMEKQMEMNRELVTLIRVQQQVKGP